MRIPRRITAKWIEENLNHEYHGRPCDSGLRWFRKMYPDGIRVSLKTVRELYISDRCIVSWFAQCVLGITAEVILWDRCVREAESSGRLTCDIYPVALFRSLKKLVGVKRKAVKA